MTKEILLEKLQKASNFPEKKEIEHIVRCLPSPIKFVPNKIKKGDIFWVNGIHHYIIAYKVNKNDCICLLLTSKDIVSGTSTNSRSLDSYIANILINYPIDFIKTLPFSGFYDNNKHLNEVYTLIKQKI